MRRLGNNHAPFRASSTTLVRITPYRSIAQSLAINTLTMHIHLIPQHAYALISSFTHSANLLTTLVPQHLLAFRSASISPILNPFELLAVASVCSIVFGLFPLVRRNWKRLPISKKDSSPEIPSHASPTENSDDTTNLEVGQSESYEEVTLSFGTDRPEVYTKMYQQDSPRSIFQTTPLRQLVVH